MIDVKNPFGHPQDEQPDGTSPSRAVSLQAYNFTLDKASLVRAQAGPPAFALRRKRLDLRLRRFWEDLDRRHQELWIAAGEGRIQADGRESRQALLDAQGRDKLGARVHAKHLFRQRQDPEPVRRRDFERAWLRHLHYCGLSAIEELVAAYNHFFPIEANLGVDPERGCYLWLGEPWEPMEAPTRDQVLARFPLHGADIR